MDIVDKLKTRKWLTIMTLIVLLGSTMLGLYFVWGALFVFWGLIAIKTGQAYLLEPIWRDDDPLLFWTLTGLWFVFGALYILNDFYTHLLI